MVTATVETLIAEVRVLMVGNRQVTLSVYRQLDEVDVMNIEPFGRVNDGKDSGTWVVGKDVEIGALVHAQYDSNPNLYFSKEEAGARPYWAIVKRGCHAHDDHTITSKIDGYTHRDYAKVWSDNGLSVYLEIGDRDWSIREGSWEYRYPELQPKIEQWAGKTIAAHMPRYAQAQRCAELPLIVLAGLR